MTTHSSQPAPPNGPDDALQRALEIHRRLQTEYGWDFMNTGAEIAARAEQAERAAKPPQASLRQEG